MTWLRGSGRAARLLPLLCAVSFFLALSFVFRDAVVFIYHSWQHEEYSHGYIIPLIAAVLLANKVTDARLVPQSSWTGFGIIAACTLFLILFEISGVKGLLPMMYFLALAGLLILFSGKHVAVPLAAPMAFLLFSVPVPALIYYQLSLGLRQLSTSLGVSVLRMLDIPVFQEGNIIDLETYQLQVADACSGLRYLFPLLSLSFLLAYLYRARFWKRALLFLSALPITIVANSFRICLIGVTVNKWGPQMATGILHDFEGWVFFVGCAVLLAVEVQALQHIGEGGTLDFGGLRLPKISALPAPALGPPTLACGILLVVGVIAGIFAPGLTTDYVRPVPLRQGFSQFPAMLGPWSGRFNKLDPDSLRVLGTDDYLMADYFKAGAAPVTVYMLYYPQQDSTANGAVHTPSLCIPTGGWTIVSNAPSTITLGSGQTLEVNRLIISKGLMRGVVYYWYNQGGKEMLVPTYSRLYLIKHAIANGTTNGAMIRVNTDVQLGESVGAAEGRLVSFLQDGLATMDSFLFPQPAMR